MEKKFKESHDVTLTLIRQCPMSNSSKLFSNTIVYTDTQTERQKDGKTHRHTDGHEHIYRAHAQNCKPLLHCTESLKQDDIEIY